MGRIPEETLRDYGRVEADATGQIRDTMKVGDIIYVKKPYTALYGKTGGSYEYHFVPGDMYEITFVDGPGSVGIKNTNGDGVPHWVGGDFEERFYTQKEWRERQLEKLI